LVGIRSVLRCEQCGQQIVDSFDTRFRQQFKNTPVGILARPCSSANQVAASAVPQGTVSHLKAL
jgi:hypothetical protein